MKHFSTFVGFYEIIPNAELSIYSDRLFGTLYHANAGSQEHKYT